MTQVPTELAWSDIHTPAWENKEEINKIDNSYKPFHLNLIQTFLSSTTNVVIVVFCFFF